MANISIEGVGTFDVKDGLRLAQAIESCGVDIGHRCGGNARCTTCRVQFSDGEPATYTRAEYHKLKERNLLGEARLSCQIVTGPPMIVQPLMRVSEMGWSDPGPDLDSTVQPEAAWFNEVELADDAS